jgi:hypothetical protein
MSVHKRRVATLKAIVAGSIVASSPDSALINEEFDGVYEAQRLPNLRRRRLLQVLHSTRALDTFLATFLNTHGISSKSSLGGYLTALSKHSSATLSSQLSVHERDLFQTQIVSLRNTYMHKAGSFPKHDHEVLTLLSDMEACLARVILL